MSENSPAVLGIVRAKATLEVEYDDGSIQLLGPYEHKYLRLQQNTEVLKDGPEFAPSGKRSTVLVLWDGDPAGPHHE